MDKLLNTKLGQYDLLEIIGKGGQGIVYKAFDTKLNRNVAIKVFAAEGLARFLMLLFITLRVPSWWSVQNRS